MKAVMGIIFSNMHDQMVSELTTHRCMGSVPVGGRYRLIDFPLSGFANAGLETVGIVTKNNYQSLMDHLGNGREWDLSRKRGGLIILPPFGRTEASAMYSGRIEALAGIMGFIKGGGSEYVLMADCDAIANIDYSKFISSHLESQADISVMYKTINLDQCITKYVNTFVLDDESNVCDMLLHPATGGTQNVYINVVIMSRKLLEQVVVDCNSRNQRSFERDILQSGVGKYRIHAVEFKGYLGRFDSLKTYYRANQAMLDSGVRADLFPKERPIYTRIRDEAPVRFGLDCRVENSLIADGCIIEGEVDNSLLFRNVVIGKGAKVKNCIVMQGSQIHDNSNLEYVITDKDVTIKDARTIVGFETYPVYISKGSMV